MESRAIRYSEFTQFVRRFRPSQLLPLLATMTARDDPNYHGFEDVRRLPPWGMAAIARESLVRGNEHRSASATPNDVFKMLNLHHAAFAEPRRESITAVAGPLIHEQFWWQRTLFEEQTRAVSVFDDPRFGDQPDWPEVFSMTLPDVIRASFVVGLVVNKNRGRWNSSMLEPLYALQGRERIRVARHLVERVAGQMTGDLTAMRELGLRYDARLERDPELAKHPLNPIMGWPIVDLGGTGQWAPVAPLTWRAFLGPNLYVLGGRRWGGSFTKLLGERYQSYVGALIQNSGDEVLPEIRYGKGEGKASVDWIWITPGAVFLVECKSAGLGIDSIAGGGRFAAIVERAIVHAREQIDRTANLVRSRAAEFLVVPADRPIYGLIVTSEPFPFANAGLDEYGQPGETDAIVASVRSIEHLTSVANAAQVLLEVFEDEERRRWDLEQALATTEAERHPIAERAWRLIDPFPKI